MNIDDFDTVELPKQTDKQRTFLREYYRNKKNRVVAYRIAYDSQGKYSTCWKEATKLLKNPSVAPYIDFYDKKYIEFAKKEVEYSVQDAFDELDIAMDAAMEGDKTGTVNVPAYLKAVELKCKLKGYGKENLGLSGDVNIMPSILIDGEKYNYKVGDNLDAENNAASNLG